MLFLPVLGGTAAIHAPAPAFVAAFVRRIESGLLPGARERVNYKVVRHGAGGLRFRAATWWTAIAVGFNDVEVTVSPDGRARYAIQYWRWAGYVIVGGGVTKIDD